MGILQKKRSMVSAMCRVQLKDQKRFKDMMLVLVLNKTTDQFTMVNSMC